MSILFLAMDTVGQPKDIQPTELAGVYQQIMKTVRVPRSAILRESMRVVYTTFKVTYSGTAEDIVVHNDIDSVFTKEIIRILVKLTGNWPAAFYNKTYLLPIEFTNGEPADDYPVEQIEKSTPVDYKFEKVVAFCPCTIRRTPSPTISDSAGTSPTLKLLD